MKYDHSKIESKWQKVWLKEGVYEPDLKSAKNPFYNLMMFPYPSAEGLHVGNMYAFVGADIYGRLKRMQGYDVFEPIGLDGFGIHSENYAIKIGQHPADQAKISEKNFYRQLGLIGNGFAWNEKLETYDPEYYKWTQWIFIQLYKKSLAYRKKASVNWCPSCLTVLADEQVIGGECERCGAKVIKKELEQWFFKITDYADRLLEGLEKIDWSEKVKIAQRNWIGKSEGASIKFDLVNIPGQEDKKHFVEVFTTRPDTIFGATFIVVSPELAQFWLDIGWQAPSDVKEYIKNNITPTPHEGRGPEKTGIFSGILAVNPANNENIPVWVADYVLGGVGTGAIMAVPAHDARDFEFAKKFNLPIIEVVKSPKPGLGKAYEEKGALVNSGKFNGMDSEKVKWEITKFVGGERKTQYRLRDWLISRQRYWGPPIPMIYCAACAARADQTRNNTRIDADRSMAGWRPVPEKDLPVKLPYIKNFRPTGTDQSPLASDENFYKVKCPKCGGVARRETDVSDTFLDSAWYYIGYLAKSQISPFSNPLNKNWLPVDMYIGGAEHSVLHLLYVRFLAMVFHDLELVQFDEPFPKFRAHGLIIKDGSKMSKSKGNVINPDEYINKYGADALRMYLMFLGPFDQGGDFRDSGIKGLTRFLERVWKISQISNFKPARPAGGSQKQNSNVQKILHKTIKKVTEDIENLQYNTAISALMILLNEFENSHEPISDGDKKIFLQLLAPFAPHLTEEIWREILKNKKSIHVSVWPEHDVKMIKEDIIDLVIQINGKTRAVIKIDVGVNQQQAEKLARSDENISKYLLGAVKKVIFVENRLINFVV